MPLDPEVRIPVPLVATTLSSELFVPKIELPAPKILDPVAVVAPVIELVVPPKADKMPPVLVISGIFSGVD